MIAFFSKWFGPREDVVSLSRQAYRELATQLEAIRQTHIALECDMSGTIVSANEVACQWLGFSCSQLIGMSARKLVVLVDHRHAASNDVWNRLERGEHCSGEFQLLNNQNQPIWVHGAWHVTRDENDKPYRTVLIASNVTSIRCEAIEASEVLGAIDRSRAVVECDLQGNILEANEKFISLSGLQSSDLVGKAFGSIFFDPDQVSGCIIQQTIQRGEACLEEFGVQSRGGKMIWIQCALVPVRRENGEWVKVVAYASDSTAQVEFHNNIEKLLGELTLVIGALARGDLSQKVTGDYPEALTAVKNDINATVHRLNEVVTHIRDTASRLSITAGEMSRTYMDLSNRSEQQAVSLDATSSQMREMTESVGENAKNAVEANSLAQKARLKAEKGGSVLGEAVSAMSEINDSSRRIADIIGVIDEIAFQTNLLALNAAVEAARAGEQGRGFAVVAEEVRNLALRSAKAASEIQDLIDDSVNKVERGSALVNDSGLVLSEIVDVVKQVSVIMSDISDANQEQASGIGKVNTSIGNMDAVIQQNAALVEQTAAVAESANQESIALVEQVSFFATSGPNAPSSGGNRSKGKAPWSAHRTQVAEEALDA